ncbi:murein hydrolase activator EnvC family protein [Sphingomonas arenae]|uniref:murein hydrolase activator EnvC family protein n=1 Tax=Sphingomonas arenae TaxID=2812555 RepID=UPI0019684778|nr:peptidoglycan DD-metalloendopeptidase family protein [Sphingomonas arenae]
MRRLALLLLAPLLVSATDPASQARADAAAAGREVQRLEQAARDARTEAEKLRAEQAAAAASIVAAESRISAAELRSAALQRQLAERKAKLAAEQRPAAMLLAGVAQMGRRPPLLALADRGSIRDFVTIRALLDTTVPVIRVRTAALSTELAKVQRLAEQARANAAELARERITLREAQQRFAALERAAIGRATRLGGQAIAAGDVALGAGEQAAMLEREAVQQRSAARLAADLGRLPPAAARPFPPEGGPAPPALDWQMPIQARVLTGLSEVSEHGVRSRGVTVDAYRGAPVLAPADGRVAFAGPFRRREGVVILDHGNGWMTLMTEVRTTLPVGSAVSKGVPIGRALGDITVELSRNGTPQPSALIARSSPLLSKTGKTG